MRLGRRLTVGLAAAIVSVSVACSSDDATDPNAPMGLGITLSPSSVTLLVTDTITTADNAPLALGATSFGHPVTTPRAEWTTSDATVALVDTSGVVSAVGFGTATITARVNGEKATSVVTVAKRVASVTLTPNTVQGLVGDTLTLTANAVDSHGTTVGGTAYVFTSTDPTAASVVRTGNRTARVTLLKAGAGGITVSAGGQSAGAATSVFARDFLGALAASAPAGALVLSAGEDATCGIISLGRGYCFGQAGLVGAARDTSCFNDVPGSGATACTLVPVRIGASLNFASVSVGDSVACGVTSGNQAYCWGVQTYGQLGNGISGSGTSGQPNLVIGAVSRSAVALMRVSAGRNHACGLTLGGTALCWGQDSAFQLGTGDARHINSTTPIPIKSSQTFTQISAGGDHTCALRADGGVVCWGDNASGQVGNGSSGDTVDTPTSVPGIFTQVSAGASHTCALTGTGAAFCWGSNTFGQLGNNTGLDSSSPVAVAGGLTFKSISAGRDGTCGITTAGAAYCWGLNDYGQVGDGSVSGSRAAPVAVTGGRTDFVAITTGVRHACALAATGAYCWGSNVLGALGNELQAMVQPSPTKTATPQ